ncbi:MAG: hypothetical protein CM1200mP5_1140 [Candidatus Pelagibacterales bacterium]|nr:MAG: hypothetical protein CM1200mP5_1140 [Pelagibacterales bacterium]
MYVCGNTRAIKKKLKDKFGDDKVGEMFCLGYCYENKLSIIMDKICGNDIKKIDDIIKGKDLEQEKFFSKSFASTSFLKDDGLQILISLKNI